MGPIDYSLQGIQSPAQALMQGVQFGAGLSQLQAQRQAAEAQAATQQAELEKNRLFQNSLQAFFSNPNRKFEDLEPVLALSNKTQLEALSSIGKRMDERERSAQQLFSGQVLAALEVDPNQARKLLEERITAESDPGKKQTLSLVLDAVKADPAKAAQTLEIVGASQFGKDWYESIAKVREERRKAAMRPLEEEAKRRQGVPTAIQEAIDFAKLTPEQQKTFQDLQLLKRPPAAVTQVTVQNLEKGASGELAKLIPSLYEQANAAASQLNDLPRYRAAVEKAITGPFAEQRLTAARIGATLGFTGEKSVEATRELIQGLAEMALKSRSMLAGQGAVTESEQALLIRARSGDINFTASELKTLFNVSERASRAQYEKSVGLLKSAAGQSETAGLFLQNVSKIEPTAPATPPTAGGGVEVLLPNGQRAIFPNQQAADAFKRRAGIQ